MMCLCEHCGYYFPPQENGRLYCYKCHSKNIARIYRNGEFKSKFLKEEIKIEAEE